MIFYQVSIRLEYSCYKLIVCYLLKSIIVFSVQRSCLYLPVKEDTFIWFKKMIMCFFINKPTLMMYSDIKIFKGMTVE